MRTDRFKVGDVLEKVRTCEGVEGAGDIWELGDVVVIRKCDGDGLPEVIGDKISNYVDDRCWEIEAIAKSPLIKAMA